MQELYEPLFDDLHEKLKASGRSIRAIWIADLAHQGRSYVMNETALGNDRTGELSTNASTLLTQNSELVGRC